jgi:hypothetical protein
MESVGCELISVDSEEFVLNANKVTYNCFCGNQGENLWRYFKTGSRCKQCTLDAIKETCMTRYGSDNPSKSEEIKQKIRDVMMERYGVEYAMQLEEFAKKSSDTNKKNRNGIHNLNLPDTREKTNNAYQDKYGAPFGFVEEHNEKARQVSKERYGHEVYIQSEQGKKDMLNKYGSEHFVHTDAFTKTMIERYGFPHAMQNPEILSKALKTGYSTKEYKFPSGKIVEVQGYEPFALDLLMSQRIDECDIIVGCENVPVINYNDGICRRYFPDIYIKSSNTVIEVKSMYTYNRDLDRNIEKFTAASRDYDFKLWIFTPKGELLIEGMFVGDMFAHFYQIPENTE